MAPNMTSRTDTLDENNDNNGIAVLATMEKLRSQVEKMSFPEDQAKQDDLVAMAIRLSVQQAVFCGWSEEDYYVCGDHNRPLLSLLILELGNLWQ